MNIVIFTHEESGELGQALVNGITACRLPEPVPLIRSIPELTFHLKTAGESRGKEILILLAETRERLGELIRLGALLEDSRLILVVPDEAPATLSAAHGLYPRFVTPLAHQYDDLDSVIRRMMTQTPGAP